jgi:rSAM/selenodomain-associated transferase 1
MHVLVMAKAPEPGRVKTRLCPPCTPAEAAALAEAALRDTLAAALASRAERCVLALDGAPGPWLPPGVTVVAQRGTTFADRLTAARAAVRGPGILIGMDTPQVTAADLDGALDALARPGCDAVLGPANDGGWWTIGLHDADDRVFDGVPTSTSTTGAAQLRRLHELGWRVDLLPTFRDVDTFADAHVVAGLAPATRFAAVLDGLLVAPS